MVYEPTNNSLEVYCVIQSLSEKRGLASPSGLVPSCRALRAQAAVQHGDCKEEPPGPYCKAGWRRSGFLGVRDGSQHVCLTPHLWLGRFGWCLESMWKPQVKFLMCMFLTLVIFQGLNVVTHFAPERQDVFSALTLESIFTGFVWNMLLVCETGAAKWVLAPAHYEMKDPQTICCKNVSKGGFCQWYLVLFANRQISINVFGIALVRNCSVALAWGFLLFGRVSYDFCEGVYPLRAHILCVHDWICHVVGTPERRWSRWT